MLWTTHGSFLRPSSRLVLAMLHPVGHTTPHNVARIVHVQRKHVARASRCTQQPLLATFRQCLTAHNPAPRVLQRCNSTAGTSPSARHRLVFLGTPEVQHRVQHGRLTTRS